MSLKDMLADIFGDADGARSPQSPAEAEPVLEAREAGVQPARRPVERANVPSARSHAPLAVAVGVAVAALFIVVGVVAGAVKGASVRLDNPDLVHKPAVAIAQEAEVAYCTTEFKAVLERVLHSCGLSSGEQRRGCKPSDIKTFAAISDDDFNALFHPLKERGGVLLFDEGFDSLDEVGQNLLDERWSDRKGARYFFVVARASKTGTPSKNRALSHRRANSVMFHLEKTTGETKAELSKKVGLLWLGNEFAQLSQEYCQWPVSRQDAKCGEEAINRSAFVSWVDCRL